MKGNRYSYYRLEMLHYKGVSAVSVHGLQMEANACPPGVMLRPTPILM